MNFANLGIDEQRDARGRRRRVRVADPADQRPCNHCDVSLIGEHLKEWEDGIGGKEQQRIGLPVLALPQPAKEMDCVIA